MSDIPEKFQEEKTDPDNNNKKSRKIMKKTLLMLGIVSCVVVVIFLIMKNAHKRSDNGLYGKIGGTIDDRLHDSKEALEKAMMRVQKIFQQIKTLKA